jgi:cation-transporting ATPase 13A1
MASFTVDDKTVKNIVFYKPLPVPLRLDVAPFFFMYSTALYYFFVSAKEWHNTAGAVALPILLFCHGLSYLGTFWSVDFHCWLAFTRVSTLEQATVVKVTPAKNCGKQQICELQQQKAAKQVDVPEMFQTSSTWFSYQQAKFCLNPPVEGQKGGVFRVLGYPASLQLSSYLDCKGHMQAANQKLAAAKWGKNEFEIPLPDFWDLFREHMVAPFFVFQVFCVGLWCLDEYWYYSVFTLMMLGVFESTVVKQRIRNLQMLRSMRKPPHQINAFRQGKWQQVSSDTLVPMDIVSVVRSKEKSATTFTQPGEDSEIQAPCDILLLRGSCVANEAMLTGESVPQLKDPLCTLSSDSIVGMLDVAMDHKKHVLFGGTKVLQVTPQAAGESTGALAGIPQPPDKGSVGLVLRTGFGTTQGRLMRTILFAAEHITAENAETMLFIGFLLVFAIFAAYRVLKEGLEDERRSRYGG